ncbi:MAG: response regulator transcription factor [Dehalococcoidales bacterium]|nr:response regulator transcription factor [Dehalococcoidales bacterium]
MLNGERKMEKIKVFISDPQVLFREGIHFTLSGEDDFEVTGEATNNEDSYTFIESNPPNIAILSMKASKASGADITCRIKRNFPSVSVILIMDKETEDDLFAAMRCGASACVSKDTDPDLLMDTIRVVAQGGQPLLDIAFTPNMASRILAEFEKIIPLSEQLNNVMARLSSKEAEILSYIVEGNKIEQIVARLNSNEATVRRQLRLIINKMVANDQAKALLDAAQRSFPTFFSAAAGKNGAGDYVTRSEFNEFKENLMQRLKALITNS